MGFRELFENTLSTLAVSKASVEGPQLTPQSCFDYMLFIIIIIIIIIVRVKCIY
jgi:hypothetical protein